MFVSQGVFEKKCLDSQVAAFLSVTVAIGFWGKVHEKPQPPAIQVGYNSSIRGNWLISGWFVGIKALAHFAKGC